MTTIEVIDAVQKSLNNEGFLHNIRAQLRSKVFQIISNGPDYVPNSSDVIDFSKTESGILSLMIVKELLQNLNLKETLSVFEIESGIEYKSNYRNEEIEKLLTTVGSKQSKGSCILERIVNSHLSESSRRNDDTTQLPEDNIPIYKPGQNTTEIESDNSRSDVSEYESKSGIEVTRTSLMDNIHHLEEINDDSHHDIEDNLQSENKSQYDKEVDVISNLNQSNVDFEEIEEIQEEVPEYESEDDKYTFNHKTSVTEAIYMDGTASPKQTSSPINSILVKSNIDINVSDTTSKASIFRLNQNSTSRSQKGWDVVNENIDDEFSPDEDFNADRKSDPISPYHVSSHRSDDDVVEELEDIDYENINNKFKVSKFVDDENESNVLNHSHRSNQDDEDDVNVYQSRNPIKAFEMNSQDKINDFEEEEEYADEDFDDDDFEADDDNNNNNDFHEDNQEESVEEEILSVEEELSIGENNSISDNDEYGIDNKRTSQKTDTNVMFRSRSGALPVVTSNKVNFDSLLDEDDSDYKMTNIKDRMREIDQKLEDLENQDDSLLKLRKEHEEYDDNSIASEDLDAMEFSTGGGGDADDVLETADSSGEGSFSFLDSSTKSGRK